MPVLAEFRSISSILGLGSFQAVFEFLDAPVEIDDHASDYRRLLEGIRDDRANAEAMRSAPRLNARLDEILGGKA